MIYDLKFVGAKKGWLFYIELEDSEKSTQRN
jgi:hypothetical protein